MIISKGRITCSSKSLKWNDENTEVIINELSRNHNLLLEKKEIRVLKYFDLITYIDDAFSITKRCVLSFIDINEAKISQGHYAHRRVKVDKP